MVNTSDFLFINLVSISKQLSFNQEHVNGSFRISLSGHKEIHNHLYITINTPFSARKYQLPEKLHIYK